MNIFQFCYWSCFYLCAKCRCSSLDQWRKSGKPRPSSEAECWSSRDVTLCDPCFNCLYLLNAKRGKYTKGVCGTVDLRPWIMKTKNNKGFQLGLCQCCACSLNISSSGYTLVSGLFQLTRQDAEACFRWCLLKPPPPGPPAAKEWWPPKEGTGTGAAEPAVLPPPLGQLRKIGSEILLWMRDGNARAGSKTSYSYALPGYPAKGHWRRWGAPPPRESGERRSEIHQLN